MSHASQSVIPLSYAGPTIHKCPLCYKRPALSKKRIYGHPVCKKCFYAFANRRQLGYLLDALIFLVPSYLLGFAIGLVLVSAGIKSGVEFEIIAALATAPVACLFYLKDGFSGRSLGRLAADTVVLDEQTHQPIGFGQSFKRNFILITSQIPLTRGAVGLVIVLIIAVQVGRGYRMGDRFAKTKVIWKRYAHLPVFGGSALVCEPCGYNLMGNVSGVCPECGTKVSELNASRLRLNETSASASPV